MFAKWKLRFLEDPKGVYGAAETVNSIGSKGLEAKAPEVAKFTPQLPMGVEGRNW